jgi:hypothetical protein
MFTKAQFLVPGAQGLAAVASAAEGFGALDREVEVLVPDGLLLTSW